MLDNLRAFLKEKSIDYLLINSTNEFLVEYNKLENNSRYLVTNFSGSTGEALLSADNLFLFVDGRYHEQADKEVDSGFVRVIKLNLGESMLEQIEKLVPSNSTFAVTSSKISLNFYNLLNEKLSKKGINIVELDKDTITTSTQSPCKVEKVPAEISGMTADEKFLEISKNLNEPEAILITNLEEIAYLTNYRSFDIEYSSCFYAKALLTKEKAIIFTESMNLDIGEHFEVKDLSEFDKEIKNYSKTNKIGIYKQNITLKDYRKIETNAVPLSENKIAEMKSVKNESEINHMQKAFAKTDIVMKKVYDIIQSEKKITEFELSVEVEKEFYKLGAKGLSFKTILASGENSSIIHYSNPDEEKIIKSGDMVLIDMGGYFEGGIATDITRTYCFGLPSPEQKEIYTAVLRAFFHTYNYRMKPGTTGFDLDKTARELLLPYKDKGFNFAHSLGHGVGIGVHESPPVLSPSMLYNSVLLPNMCFTLEPGLYKPKAFGVRLENTVHLTKNYELRSFSKAPFDLKLIDMEKLSKSEKKLFEDWNAE